MPRADKIIVNLQMYFQLGVFWSSAHRSQTEIYGSVNNGTFWESRPERV